MLKSLPSSALFKRLVRFVPRSDPSKILIGQPRDDTLDVGLALRNGQDVQVDLFSGSSVLSPGQQTGKSVIIDRVLSPLQMSEVDEGLDSLTEIRDEQYKQHAAEVKMSLPSVPTVFMKPHTSIGDPWPAPTVLPKLTQQDDCGDYESELAVVLGPRPAKNVPESQAMDYVWGYTACNDISSRTSQFAQTQWGFSKGFDTACPLGPTMVSPAMIPDPSKLRVRGIKIPLEKKASDEDTMVPLQDCRTDDLIFSVPKLISFLSQGTTLPPGTVIITGTPGGVGIARKPKVTIRAGDEFRVEISPHIGTLVNVFENEQ
ncbi:hypothetical protein H2204_015467 [Knufia peltigerae]|uniref:Fumarylacetoacetase-like C-terminal domain-containing protein n=1 Tax=Knufia peltigerae TaxID=1002370 RepID=A0AA38XAX4_9EURO|nr:hypothetical protein H2204_015467 [Knufia peltigerae]